MIMTATEIRPAPISQGLASNWATSADKAPSSATSVNVRTPAWAEVFRSRSSPIRNPIPPLTIKS